MTVTTTTTLHQQHRYGIFLLVVVCLLSVDGAVFAFTSPSSTHNGCTGKFDTGSPLSWHRRRVVGDRLPASTSQLYAGRAKITSLSSTFNDQQQQQREEKNESSPMSDKLLKTQSPSNNSNGNASVETWVDESKHVELVGLIAWMASISAFILMNNYVGPWPSFLHLVPERLYFLGHMLGAMLFGGGVVLTTCIEYMVAKNKNPAVMQFWFDKVPLLDMALVLPGLTLSMVSGTGLTIVRYGGLAYAPAHIVYAFWALVVFAAWWAVTDLTTQGSALNAVMEARVAMPEEADEFESIPDEVNGRTVSNVVSCLLVLVMYGIMVMKPGTLHYF